MKTDFKPGTMIYPVPAVLVSCGETESEFNLVTIAWTGTICTNPPMCYISVRPERHSYGIIKRTGEFVINLTTNEMTKKVDWCGVRSGREFNKFREMNLTPGPSKLVKAPIVMESPVNIECRVTEIKELGTHHMFMAEVVNIQVNEKLIHADTGKLNILDSGLIAYVHGNYCVMGKRIGTFGYSVARAKEGGRDRTPAGR
jgi:flavin reductase (DIM6/NTAB) family NADH-FMN oxidoreductase RutF